LKFHLSNFGNQKIFTAHGAGYVTVSGERFEQSIVVTPEQVLSDWHASDFENLEEIHFNFLLPLQPEVVLFGTGDKQRFAHPSLYRALTDARIAVEFMDTPAACRTYNILMAEDRRVVAGILLASPLSA
jgi:uncharacterized protein